MWNGSDHGKDMNRTPQVILAALSRIVVIGMLAYGSAACSQTSRHGDAVLTVTHEIYGPPGYTTYHLTFPTVSLARRAIYRFRVRDLPSLPFQYGIYLTMPISDEFKHDRQTLPWANASVRIRIEKPEGQLVNNLDLRLGEVFRGVFIDHDECKYSASLATDWWLGADYDIVIEVIEASTRLTDTLEIGGNAVTEAQSPVQQ
jgi:hypothetical protein